MGAPSATPYVYFLRQEEGDGPVKIGHSRVPADRLKAFAHWSPYPLIIAATIEGALALELRFHAKFRDHHSHLEWFRPSAEMDAVIADINAGTFDVASLPAPRRAPRDMSIFRSAAYRERHSLNLRVNRMLRASGFDIDRDIGARLTRFIKLSTDEQTEVRDATLLFLSQPEKYGRELNAPWARKLRRAFLKAAA